MTLKAFTTSDCPDINCPGQGAYHEHTVYMEVFEDEDNSEKLNDIIGQTCYSIYKGCACHGDKGHDGKHSCALGCKDIETGEFLEWTDEDSKNWIASYGK